MSDTIKSSLVPGDQFVSEDGCFMVLVNDTANEQMTVAQIQGAEGKITYDSMGDITPIEKASPVGDYVLKAGDTMTGTLTVLGPGQYVLCENPSTGEQVMISPANIFFKRPEFNAAFFLRAGEGGNLYFQDQATGKVIQLTDLSAAP